MILAPLRRPSGPGRLRRPATILLADPIKQVSRVAGCAREVPLSSEPRPSDGLAGSCGAEAVPGLRRPGSEGCCRNRRPVRAYG